MTTILRVQDSTGIQKCEKFHIHDAGFDVRSMQNDIVEKGKIKLIHTGLYFEIPKGYEIQVRPRSGLALKHGVTVLNSPGTIDSAYKGECNIILINLGDQNFVIAKGDRVAQFVLCKLPSYTIEFTDKIAGESRGGGFGHTGTQ